MELLDDSELEHLLRRWVAPAAPRSLEEKLFGGQLPWWQRLLNGIQFPSLTLRRSPRRKNVRKV